MPVMWDMLCSPQPLHGEGEGAAPPRGQREDPPGPQGWSSASCVLCRLPLTAARPWLQVAGPALQALTSSTSSGTAGAPAPAGVGLQTWGGAGSPKQKLEFKYCFREVKDGQVRDSGRLQVQTLQPEALGLRGPSESYSLRF